MDTDGAWRGIPRGGSAPCPVQPSRPLDSEKVQELVAVSSVVEGLVLGLSVIPLSVSKCLPPPEARECSPHCLGSTLAAEGTLDAGMGTTLASSTRGHWRPHHRAMRPLCQAATSLKRWGWLLVWEMLSRELPLFLLHVCAYPLIGPFYY